MTDHARKVPYRDRSRALVAIGIVLLLVGGGCALLGPVELYCFYLFSEGGRFHYEGFGFGSLLFAIIAVQILGYYVIAAVCLPLGYGHLKLRRWARTVALAGLGFWLAAGIPLAPVFLAMFAIFKDPSAPTLLAAALLTLLLYPILPIVLVRFYASDDVRKTCETATPQSHWTDRAPLPILVLCMLYASFILAVHTAVLFRGAFPLFGFLVTELPGFALITVSMALLGLLIWGTFKRLAWAWWGGLIYFGLAIVSLVWTFSPLSWTDIVSAMRFAPLEAKALSGIPARGWHIAAFFAPPLLATLAVILASRRHFGSTARHNLTEQSTMHR